MVMVENIPASKIIVKKDHYMPGWSSVNLLLVIFSSQHLLCFARASAMIAYQEKINNGHHFGIRRFPRKRDGKKAARKKNDKKHRSDVHCQRGDKKG